MGIFNSIKSFINNDDTSKEAKQAASNNNVDSQQNVAQPIGNNINNYPHNGYANNQVNSFHNFNVNQELIMPSRYASNNVSSPYFNPHNQHIAHHQNPNSFSNHNQPFNNAINNQPNSPYIEPYYNHNFDDFNYRQNNRYYQPNQYNNQPNINQYPQYNYEQRPVFKENIANAHYSPQVDQYQNNSMFNSNMTDMGTSNNNYKMNANPNLANQSYDNFDVRSYQNDKPVDNLSHLSPQVNAYVPLDKKNSREEFDKPLPIPSTTLQERYVYKPEVVKPKKNKFYISKEQANSLMPIQIASEIKAEKIRTIIMMLIGTLGIITTSMFIAMYYYVKNTNSAEVLGIEAKYIPHPFITITLLIVSLGVSFGGIFDFARVRNEANNYLMHLSRGNHTIPHFLIDNYKKMVVRGIVLNWVAFPFYFLGAAILGILYGFQQHQGSEFVLGFWSLGAIQDLTTPITIIIILLITMLAVHIANIIISKKRKSNINSYYGYQIVNPEELKELRKRTNRICLIVFIIFAIILTLLISIPYLLARRKRKGKGVPLFGKLFNKD